MSWRDISKSSYTIESGKFTIPRPSRPFTIPYQGPKVVYSEGDELSSVADYTFNIDFTGIPLGPDHFPCGYWHKNYIPPFTIVYTSLMYAVEVVESAGTDVINLISGQHRLILQVYGFEDYVETTNVNLVSGVFRASIIVYSYTESVETSNVNIVSGIFKDALWSYTIPTESVETSNLNLSSGMFKDAVLSYTYWPAEGVETSSVNLTSGVHNDP